MTSSQEANRQGTGVNDVVGNVSAAYSLLTDPSAPSKLHAAAKYVLQKYKSQCDNDDEKAKQMAPTDKESSDSFSKSKSTKVFCLLAIIGFYLAWYSLNWLTENVVTPFKTKVNALFWKIFFLVVLGSLGPTVLAYYTSSLSAANFLMTLFARKKTFPLPKYFIQYIYLFGSLSVLSIVLYFLTEVVFIWIRNVVVLVVLGFRLAAKYRLKKRNQQTREQRQAAFDVTRQKQIALRFFQSSDCNLNKLDNANENSFADMINAAIEALHLLQYADQEIASTKENLKELAKEEKMHESKLRTFQKEVDSIQNSDQIKSMAQAVSDQDYIIVKQEAMAQVHAWLDLCKSNQKVQVAMLDIHKQSKGKDPNALKALLFLGLVYKLNHYKADFNKVELNGLKEETSHAIYRAILDTKDRTTTESLPEYRRYLEKNKVQINNFLDEWARVTATIKYRTISPYRCFLCAIIGAVIGYMIIHFLNVVDHQYDWRPNQDITFTHDWGSSLCAQDSTILMPLCKTQKKYPTGWWIPEADYLLNLQNWVTFLCGYMVASQYLDWD